MARSAGDVFDGGVADPPNGVEHCPAPHRDRRCDRDARGERSEAAAEVIIVKRTEG